jgi:hypothetical protein
VHYEKKSYTTNEAPTDRMSWMSDDTGRPLEEGGHKRIDISLDLNTRKVLDTVGNRSKLVEYCIRVFVQPKWEHYIEPEEAVCNGSGRFTEGASFEFVPHFNPGNAVLGVNCYFDQFCDKEGIAFRVSVNGKKGLTLVEHPLSDGYSCSQVYSEEELGFFNMEKTFRDQEHYVFKFEFKSLTPMGMAGVKDIHFSVVVIENPLLNEISDVSCLDGLYKRK